jgi:hypothetical protein
MEIIPDITKNKETFDSAIREAIKDIFPTDLDAQMGERLAGKFLDLTPRFLQAGRVNGNGPKYIRVSARCVKYRKRDLIAWQESLLVSSTSEPVK